MKRNEHLFGQIYSESMYDNYEAFTDKKEYEDLMKRSREECSLPQSYVQNYNAGTAFLFKSFEVEKKKRIAQLQRAGWG